MSLKDCLRIVKTLDPADRDSFNTEFDRLTKGGIKPEDAYMEAAEVVMEQILGDRNDLAGEIHEAGGFLGALTLEHLVNPASYPQAGTGTAADIGSMSADDFDVLIEDATPKPTKDLPAPEDADLLGHGMNEEPPTTGKVTQADIDARVQKNEVDRETRELFMAEDLNFEKPTSAMINYAMQFGMASNRPEAVEVWKFVSQLGIDPKKGGLPGTWRQLHDRVESKKPAPKEITEEGVARVIQRQGGKKLRKEGVKQLRLMAKAVSIPTPSKLNKQGLIDALISWHDARSLAALPAPMEGAALTVGIYSHANSGSYTIIQASTPSFWADDAKVREMSRKSAMLNAEAIAKHFGGSVQKKATMYNGDKTDKGIHFAGWKDAARFIQHYTGKTPIEPDATEGGSTRDIKFVGDARTTPVTAKYKVGDKVKIVRHGDFFSGLPAVEIVGIEIDPVDNAPLYYINMTDPEGVVYEEVFFPEDLEEIRINTTAEANQAIKDAAALGVEGIDEAITGVLELFGGKGKFSSGFTFDEESYEKAKPHFKSSLEKFVASGQSLKAWVKFWVDQAGEGIKQYLKRFHQDIVDGKIIVRGVNDVQPTTQEPDAAGEPRAESADREDTEDAGVDTAEVSEETSSGPAEEESTFDSSIGLPVDSSLDVGEQGDIDVLGDTGEFPPAASTAGHQDGRRGNVVGTEGVSAETPGDQQVKAAALQTRDRLKLKPTTDTWIAADPQNIAESAPALFPEQVDDVYFAEQRLFDNAQRGVMFTNGTGTGKTMIGLGLTRRMVMQGKDNILIVVPGEKIASDWIKTGKVPAFNLTITKLKNIKDAGHGVVITTYANLSENNELVKRNWDLIIHDEAHKLSENMAGRTTNALNKSRALTGHPDGAWAYAAAMESKLLDKISGITDAIKHFMEDAKLNPEQAGTFTDAAAKLSDELDELQIIWRERSKKHTENRAELWVANTTKRLDLTATPFAYEKSTDHAEGFLFEYDRSIDQQSRGYNQPDSRGAFMVEHFGYRMRYGKLTEPEADVDRGLMQREFNQWLKGLGALRGRILTVDHDYSREFIAIDDLVGKKIDGGWDEIRARSMDKENPNQKGYELMEKALRKHFNYHARVRMLETIKARFAVIRANQHMALGRKVVLFHSRIQGGTMNPFHIFAVGAAAVELDVVASNDEMAMYQAASAEFVAEFHDLMTLDINTVRPLDLFEQEFGDKMTLYNGTITNKQKRENPDKFNSDGEEIHVIVVQDEAGKEGISLHDATGANQRVLINLGLPVRPTQAIQIEGRIYRVGQMSNAIFEYFNTGTSFERMTFAEKISERASTAENLAMGEQARTLKDSFIDAFEEPSFEDPSEAQGVGGKEIDRANWSATSEFERAKTHYFGTIKTTGKRDQREGLDYFATPEPLGVKMVEWSGVKPTESILEPSAGHGAIARYFPENVNATFIEPSSELISRLALRAPGNHRQMRFEDLDVGGNKFSAIVMNPPFGAGGSTAIAHLHKAMHHLKNSGRIVALIPEGPAADKKFDNMFYGKEGELEAVREQFKKKRREGGSVAEETRRIEDLTNYQLRASISLPPITFKRSGTAVRARIVVIDRIDNSQAAIVSQPPRELHADTIKELFDKIEDMGVPERTERSEDPRDYLANEGLVVSEDSDNGVWRILGKTYEHRSLIKRALGDDVEFAGGAWVSTVDPVDPLYQEMIKPDEPPQEAPQAAPVWVKQDYQEYKSTDASINKRLNPVTIGIVEKNYGWESGTINADLGGGMHDNTVEYMEGIGVEHVVYDPFNRSDEYNSASVAKIRNGQADTVTINNTLNVVKEPELRRQLLMEAENALKPGGQLYIQIYEGDGSGVGRNTKGDIWQENRKATSFLTEIKTIFPNAEIKYGLISAQKFITAVKPDMAAAAAALFEGRAGQLPNAPKPPESFIAGLEITRGKTKVGKEVWEVTGNTREHKELLKALGGRWYGPKKAWSFYDGNPFDRIAAALEKPAHLRGRRGGTSTPSQVASWIRTQRKRIHGRIKIEIVNKASDIGEAFPADIQGTFADGVIYLVSENIGNRHEAVTALEHEVVGHLGLEGSLGKRKFNELLGDVTNLRIEALLNPGVHPVIENIMRSLKRRYVDKAGNYNLSPREEAREILAHIAQSKPRLGPIREIYNKLVTWMKQFLARHGFGDASMARIEELLGRAVGYVGADVVAANKINMVVAGLDPSGKLVVGELGDLHFNLVDRYGSDLVQREYEEYGDVGEWLMGFVNLDEPNKFLDRQAAFAIIRAEDPDFAMIDDELGELDSLDIVNISDTGLTIEQIQEKSEEYAYMRGPEYEPSREEKELARKFGMEGKKTLWQKLNNLRLRVIIETLDNIGGRGYEGLFDGLIEIKRKEIESNIGLGIGDYENSAYVSARLATGIADMMTHIMHYGPLQWHGGVAAGIPSYIDQDGVKMETRGLLDVLGDLGTENLNDWLMWMGAHRAEQLMKEGRERNLTADEIKAGIAKAGKEGSDKHRLFTRIKNEYGFMNKMMLDFAQTAGLIDKVKRAEWESEWYVPFYRMSEDEIEAPRLKRGLSHQEANIRRLYGSEIPTANLLENIITNWLNLTDASVKNHALRLMIDNFDGKEDIEGYEYITHETMRFTKVLVPRSEIRKRVMADRAFARQIAKFMGMDETVNNLEVINELNKVPAKGFEQLWGITAPKADDIVRLKRNGKNEYWKINVPGLLRATGHIRGQSSNSKGMRAGRWFKRLLTTGVTMSPDFMLRNFIRDAAHSWAINPDNMWFGIDAVTGLKKAMSKQHPLYMAAMASGASFQGGYIAGTDPEAGALMIRRELEKRGLTDAAIHAHFGSIVNSPAKLKAAVLRGWQGYRAVGDRIENANRIATLDRALKAGKPLVQALFESKDLMDYSRRGNFWLLITFTDLMPFLNARMQGVDKLGRAARQHPKILARKILLIAAFSVALAMWNDEEERYKELQDWEKDAYWHIFIWGEHIRIPKPFEIGIIAGTLPERAWRVYVAKSQPSEKLLWSFRHNLMETLNINYGIPQFLLPVAEVALNRSLYFDQPIESFSDEGRSPRERYNSFTSNTAMEIGDTDLANWLGLSPKRLQHLWNGYTGTMGAYALKTADMIVRGASGEHPSRDAIMPHDWPVLRSVYQGQRVKGTQWATDFYDRMKEVRELHGDMMKYRAQGKTAKALAYRELHSEKLKQRKKMEKVQTRFSAYRRRQDNILLDSSLSSVEKYQKRQAIQIQINQLAKMIEGETRAAFTE